MFSETSFDNSFSEFRQIREVRYGTIVSEIFLIKTRLLEMRMNRTILELIRENASRERQIDDIGDCRKED